MDLIVGTSRAGPLVSILEDDSKDWRAAYYKHPEISSIKGAVYPGAKLKKVTTESIKLMRTLSAQEELRPVMIYMVCGMPDTTEMIVDYYRGVRYEEVITTEPPQQTAQRVIEELEDSSRGLITAGAIPVFATVAPISFESWNTYRMNVKRRTSHLIHYKEYENMQEIHNTAVAEINSHIVFMNSRTGVNTPHLASYVLQKRGWGLAYRFRHKRLYDGCHTCPFTTDKWVEEMISTITRNRVMFA